jgi:hypothetical protein
MNKNKAKAKGGCLIIGIILAALSIPAVILSYTQYFAFDSQIEGNPYKIAFEKDGQLYELGSMGSSLAFDHGTADDQLYTHTPYFLGELISLSYHDFEVAKTDNPFFAGTIRHKQTGKYIDQQTKYINPKDSYQSYTFYDQNRNPILAYEPETENEYVVKLRPTFPSFSKSRYSIGRMRDYLNATKLLREKLNKNLKVRLDEANKLLILSFEQ